MKVKEKIITIYICEVCGSEYAKKYEAKECEQKPTTQPEFIKGDLVTGANPNYLTTGRVIKVVGPVSADKLTASLFDDPMMSQFHVFKFLVQHDYPKKSARKKGFFYGQELRLRRG